jgi:hypothetical protein
LLNFLFDIFTQIAISNAVAEMKTTVEKHLKKTHRHNIRENIDRRDLGLISMQSSAEQRKRDRDIKN